jgi:hypothetical protein
MRWAKKKVAQKSRPFESGLETEAVAAIEIRDITLAARADAEWVASGQSYEVAGLALERYLASRDRCIQAAKKLSDPFYRDLALHYIYGLCKRANDDTAQRIFEQIEMANVRGDIVEGRGALFD